MNSLIAKINEEGRLKDYINIGTLNVDQKYEVLSFEKSKTQYGEKVLVDCEDFKTILPQRFTLVFSADRINNLNESISSRSVKVFLISKGAIGQTTNIEFSTEKP